jgi:hypothetical protein
MMKNSGASSRLNPKKNSALGIMNLGECYSTSTYLRHRNYLFPKVPILKGFLVDKQIKIPQKIVLAYFLILGMIACMVKILSYPLVIKR